jgi:hypothetical protein
MEHVEETKENYNKRLSNQVSIVVSYKKIILYIHFY